MPRRCVRALQLGDSDNLSDDYWALHTILYDLKFKVDKNFKHIYALSESELVYLYWELVHSRITHPLIKMNVRVFREYLVDEFMNRKYKRGRYKDGKE